MIGSRDAVFARLRLWVDVDHDGRSDPGELFGLADQHIVALDLRHRRSPWRDRHGNELRYAARVYDAPGAEVGRLAYDVFFTVTR